MALLLPLTLFMVGCHISAQRFQIQTLKVPDSRPEFAEEEEIPQPTLEVDGPIEHMKKRKESHNRMGGIGSGNNLGFGDFKKCSHNCEGWPNQLCRVNDYSNSF